MLTSLLRTMPGLLLSEDSNGYKAKRTFFAALSVDRALGTRDCARTVIPSAAEYEAASGASQK